MIRENWGKNWWKHQIFDVRYPPIVRGCPKMSSNIRLPRGIDCLRVASARVKVENLQVHSNLFKTYSKTGQEYCSPAVLYFPQEVRIRKAGKTSKLFNGCRTTSNSI